MRSNLYDIYLEIIHNIEGIPESMAEPFARELVRRQKKGWVLPITVYRRRKDILYYKDSLERNSPYYIDLLKIDDRNHLKLVLQEIYYVIRIHKNSFS